MATFLNRMLLTAALLAMLALVGCTSSSSGGGGGDTNATGTTGGDTGDEIPDTGDYIAFLLDEAAQVVIAEETASNSLGADPFVGGARSYATDYIETLVLDGAIADADGEITGGDRVLLLSFPNSVATHDDTTDSEFQIVYSEGFDFEAIDGDLIFTNGEDGESTISVTAIGDVGGEITGTYAGTLDSHTLTGSFRITREEDGFFDDVPFALADLGLCSDGVEEEGELVPDASAVGTSVETDQCDLWSFTATADGTVTVIVTMTAGNADLYVADDLNTGTLVSSTNTGTAPEVVTLEASTGDVLFVAVAGVVGAAYEIQVVNGLYDALAYIDQNGVVYFADPDTGAIERSLQPDSVKLIPLPASGAQFPVA